jgi:hypothetical protein
MEIIEGKEEQQVLRDKKNGVLWKEKGLYMGTGGRLDGLITLLCFALHRIAINCSLFMTFEGSAVVGLEN